MKPPIFIELCAGTAALSLRLQGGPKAKPPVSRMGAKTGYADAILAVLGLYPGQGAESYLWCEPDDGVRGLLMAYPQPEVLRAAAKILRGWKDEEPRALWERLRAELKAGAAVEGAEGVARYILVIGQTWPHKMDGRPMRQWAQKTKEEGGCCIATLIEQAQSIPSLPPTFIARDGRAVTPEEVARYAFVAARTMPQATGRGEIGAGDGERERACPSHRAVADVIFGAPPSDRWGAEVVAVAQLASGTSASPAELVDHAAAHLARYKLPKAVVFVDQTPRNPNGKADYKAATALAVAAPASPS